MSQVKLTEAFQHYRLCLRDIWNRYFWSDSALRHADSADWFSKLKPILFEALVVEKLAKSAPSCDWDSIEAASLRFEVVPNNVSGAVSSALLIVLDSKPTGEKHWEANERVEVPSVRLRYLDFFDWNGFTTYVDVRYILVRIEDSVKYPQWVGKEGLVDVADCDIYWQEPSELLLN